MVSSNEHMEQVTVVKYCDLIKIPYFAIPNGSHKSRAGASKFKAEGLRAGVPDLCIPVPNEHYHGLFIEMKKAKGGKVSEEQASWIHLLNENGYKAIVCHGAKEAIIVIDEYMKGMK